jgi:hypothetical protein
VVLLAFVQSEVMPPCDNTVVKQALEELQAATLALSRLAG